MDTLFSLLPLSLWIAAFAVAFAAGAVKGVVGFAMPLVMVSGLGAFISPELALAGLILPTLAANIFQAFRAGLAAAVEIARHFRWFLVSSSLLLVLSAQLVPVLPPRVYLLLLGIPIVAFVISQFLGWLPTRTVQTRRIDISLGAVSGFFGGIAGIWGPPTVAYLTALGTPKRQQMQAQGVIYFAGSILLVASHTTSGILTAATSAFSAALIAPAMLGMLVGTLIQDRIDQVLFRRATLVVLLVAGANLVRRGLIA